MQNKVTRIFENSCVSCQLAILPQFCTQTTQLSYQKVKQIDFQDILYCETVSLVGGNNVYEIPRKVSLEVIF